MNIREWAGQGKQNVEKYSKVDLVIDNILKTYYEIFLTFAGNCSLENIDELKIIVEKEDDNVHFEFLNWAKEEGIEFFESMSNTFYEDNDVLKEELKYLEFIVKSELNNMDKYSSDVIISLVEIADKMQELLETAKTNET